MNSYKPELVGVTMYDGGNVMEGAIAHLDENSMNDFEAIIDIDELIKLAEIDKYDFKDIYDFQILTLGDQFKVVDLKNESWYL